MPAAAVATVLERIEQASLEGSFRRMRVSEWISSCPSIKASQAPYAIVNGITLFFFVDALD
jgi:hypothetical protein